jgi:hypothetical protein
MNPVCGSKVVDENPVETFFCCPNKQTLLAGIFDRFVRPPAVPIWK